LTTIQHSNTVIAGLAIDEWVVTFGTARSGLSGLRPRPSPPRCTKCNSPPIDGQCINALAVNGWAVTFGTAMRVLSGR